MKSISTGILICYHHHIALKPSLKDFEHNLTSMLNCCNYLHYNYFSDVSNACLFFCLLTFTSSFFYFKLCLSLSYKYICKITNARFLFFSNFNQKFKTYSCIFSQYLSLDLIMSPSLLSGFLFFFWMQAFSPLVFCYLSMLCFLCTVFQ